MTARAMMVQPRTPYQFAWDGDTSYSEVVSGASADGTITIETDGTVTDTFTTTGVSVGWWSGQPVSGIGTGRYVRFAKTSGDDLNFGLDQDTWYEITEAREFGVQRILLGDETWNGTIDFSDDGVSVDYQVAGVVLVAQRTV